MFYLFHELWRCTFETRKIFAIHAITSLLLTRKHFNWVVMCPRFSIPNSSYHGRARVWTANFFYATAVFIPTELVSTLLVSKCCMRYVFKIASYFSNCCWIIYQSYLSLNLLEIIQQSFTCYSFLWSWSINKIK